MTALTNRKKIVLGITGSIAAYKAAELVRLLKGAEYDVRVVMTEGAAAFISPLTLQTLSEHPVHQWLFDPVTEATMSHIELARWADLVLIAPATAHIMAKLAHGMADDLLSTLCLATQAPLMIAPALNSIMWQNAVTQANVALLKRRGVEFIGPDSGVQACHEVGVGRLVEPAEIVGQIQKRFNRSQYLKNKRLIITAGPTQEAIDPVRFISNHSSGKMGYALAEAAVNAGAKVVLISGPTNLPAPPNVILYKVTSALEMETVVFQEIHQCDIYISAAAIADYRVEFMHLHKMKKNHETLTLELIKNPDILQSVAEQYPNIYTVGFAAETENLIANAREKLQKKSLDMVIANWVGEDCGFHTDENEVTLLTEKFERKLARAPKIALAIKIISIIASEVAAELKPSD